MTNELDPTISGRLTDRQLWKLAQGLDHMIKHEGDRPLYIHAALAVAELMARRGVTTPRAAAPRKRRLHTHQPAPSAEQEQK
jgi:hypothetical protein